MRLLSVSKADLPPYFDISHSVDDHGERVERWELAPVEAFYEVTVEADGQVLTFDAEVRRTPHGLHWIDWADELGDLMGELDLPQRAYDQLGLAILDVHRGDPLDLPLHLGAPSPSPDGAV